MACDWVDVGDGVGQLMILAAGQSAMTHGNSWSGSAAAGMGLLHLTVAGGQNSLTAAGVGLLHLTMAGGQNSLTAAGMGLLHLTVAGGQNSLTTAAGHHRVGWRSGTKQTNLTVAVGLGLTVVDGRGLVVGVTT